MTAPAVSIILPTFNRLKYLRPAIDSVFAQTLADWELLIADDGSDQETRAYLRGLESLPRVKLIWLSHSGNPSAVRNAALREARGDYIAFLDSDDLWMPAKLERQIDALRTCSRCRWIYTGYARIDDAGKPATLPSPKPWIPYRGAILEQLLRLEAAVATAAVLVERPLLAQVGGFDEELLLFEHYDLWLRLACHSDVELIDEPLTCLRSHERHHSEAGIPRLAGRRGLLNKARSRVTDPHLRKIIVRLSAQNAVTLANRLADADRLEALKILLASCRYSSRNIRWWMGVSRVLLKMTVPRRLFILYRRGRARPAASARARAAG
jgi:glycosyltransferase involved in cell wall biosynthesis